ncbi:hypothetical protein N2152v2_010483 [Parachlorella kessleri]
MVLDIHGPHLMAAELALVGYFTSLTVLRCDCNLSDGVEALGSLSSLKQLQQLSITAHKPPAGAQLPPSLSALSALQSLSLTTAWGSFGEPRLHLSLPWPWCLAATQVTSMQLDAVDLPLLREHSHWRGIQRATSSISGSSSSIFPALQYLELGSAYDRIDTTALGCCQALEELRIELSQTGTAVWALISQLSQLQTLELQHCRVEAEADEDEDGEPLPLPQSLSSLTSLTKLDIQESNFHKAMAQLPAVRELRLWDIFQEFQAVAGWPLPEGPWLRNLETLDVVYSGIGSIEAVLDIRGPHLMAAELALVSYFTSLTVLRCDCNLADGVKPLGSLVSLKQLQQLSITAHKPPAGAQLPPRLSALSALQSLSLTTVQGRFDEPRKYLSLPWEWCLTANQVTSMQLDAVDLPLLQEHSHGRGISGATSSISSSSSIFPALRNLELRSAGDRIAATALGCCQTLEHLKIELSQTGTAVWALIAQLSQLQALAIHNCSVEPEADADNDGELLPLPQSLSSLTSLTKLDIQESSFHPAMAQLPAVQEFRLWDIFREFQAVAGWGLPEGPWLRNLETLDVVYSGIGDIEAVLRQATRLHTLSFQNCYWMRLRRPQLHMLLRLPLREFVLSKRPESDEIDLPEPLWDEETLWVVEKLSKALKPGVIRNGFL